MSHVVLHVYTLQYDKGLRKAEIWFQLQFCIFLLKLSTPFGVIHDV